MTITHKFIIVNNTQIQDRHLDTNSRSTFGHKFKIVIYTQIQDRHLHTNSRSSFGHKYATPHCAHACPYQRIALTHESELTHAQARTCVCKARPRVQSPCTHLWRMVDLKFVSNCQSEICVELSIWNLCRIVDLKFVSNCWSEICVLLRFSHLCINPLCEFIHNHNF